MQQVAIVKTGVTQHKTPLLRRFLAKLVIDVLPATLTSIAGGLLVAHYQFGYAALRPATVQAAPASVEMVQLVRDEHSAIMDYLKAQVAAEKSRNAAADAADARAVAEAKEEAKAEVKSELKPSVEASAAPVTVRPVPAAVITPKPVVARKTVVATAGTTPLPPHAPLVVAQAAPEPVALPEPQPEPQPKSLLSRTLDLKDHVVGATLHAVSAIGGIPSWIASMGDHNDNADTTTPSAPPAAGRSFTS